MHNTENPGIAWVEYESFDAQGNSLGIQKTTNVNTPYDTSIQYEPYE